jgi:TRAP-type uncharacterized transport system substrate-binding protein
MSPPNRPEPSNGSEERRVPAHERLVRPRLRRRRNRWVWALASLFAIAAGSLAFYKYWTRPAQLTAAVVEDAGNELAVLTAYSRYFAANKTGLRMSVQTYKTRGDVAQAFLDKRADLAVLRAEANLLGRASVVAVMNRTIGLVVSLDPKIDEIEKLRGKRVALFSVNGAADTFFAALLQAYDLTDSDVQLVNVDSETLARLVAEKKVDAIVSAAPIVSRRSGEAIRAILRLKNVKAKLLPVTHVDELVRRAPAFEDYDIAERSFGELPEEETKSVAMPTNLVAQSTMPNEVAAALARQFLSNKQAVNAEAPSAAQIAAPKTDKDAFVRVHPGVAAYIDNEELTFFDKYGDLVYIAAMVGGVFASGFVALRRSFGHDSEADACDLIDELFDLRREARDLPHLRAADLPGRWRDLSERFEEKLALALPLIADGGVGDRTVQALSTALTAAERAIADIGALAFGYQRARRDGVERPGGASGGGFAEALSDL